MPDPHDPVPQDPAEEDAGKRHGILHALEEGVARVAHDISVDLHPSRRFDEVLDRVAAEAAEREMTLPEIQRRIEQLATAAGLDAPAVLTQPWAEMIYDGQYPPRG